MHRIYQHRIARFQRRLSRSGAVILLALMPVLGQHTSGPRVIHGSLSPEMIPDNRAYSLLLRFISNRSNQELVAIHAYLATLGLGKEACSTCGNSQSPPDIGKINALIAIGQAYSARANELDLAYRNRSGRNMGLDPKVEAAALEREKDALCATFISVIPTTLGAADAERVRLHVQRMKRHITLLELE